MAGEIVSAHSKLGIKIQGPADVRLSSVYPILMLLSLALIGFSGWLLMLEYLGEPVPAWLNEFLSNLSLTI